MSDDYEEEETAPMEVWPGDNVTISLINDGYETTIAGKVIAVRSEAYLDLGVITADGEDIGHQVVETLHLEISGIGWINVTDTPISRTEEIEE